MATLAALGLGLGRQRPARGRAVLLFQPAEENGAGAAAVVADPRYREIAPDYAFALHNMPGLPLGQVALAVGPMSCASRGMRIVLTGKTAHAADARGRDLSPMRAVAGLMPALAALGPGGPLDEGFRLVTVTHARMGEPSFGIAPGHAEVWATLRTLTDAGMAGLCAEAEALARGAAVEVGLGVAITYEDVFVHCENEPEAVVHPAPGAGRGRRAARPGRAAHAPIRGFRALRLRMPARRCSSSAPGRPIRACTIPTTTTRTS